MGTMENFMERKWENFGKELLMHLWGPWAVSITRYCLPAQDVHGCCILCSQLIWKSSSCLGGRALLGHIHV